ncbi:aaa atpase domain-containing protein [Fusarium phyllophilum]|uniref:Aaa atpase domain-containing protein n=1 Tax=Fusarium phyllophilum TaxID=47803 RepID=A0A8H5JCZ0_9HYPO|nr:aaa atpase domain-containing protein [Fusarium phyllophilum]
MPPYFETPSDDKWEFQCNDPNRGSDWDKYESKELLQKLTALEPFKNLNILILAIGGKFVETEIKIGSSQSEKDGSGGQSATQSTEVYTVDIGKTRVRLIDTPGIGDTRGIDQDNSNMSDILTVLRTYNNLPGVLILLKPNAARLTVMFRFCIKQLLAHLHRNAASNIMFGFTNTRVSNYMPGDTFKPLNALLSEYKEVDIGLLESNVYCFDSESFRYLAENKKGVDMGHLEDNRRSWEYSVGECERLVMHCQSITPHKVRGTINLNETRTTICRLTEPMAFIAEKISASIDVNNVAIRELHDFELTRQELQDRLFVQKETLRSEKVDKPRTVCTHDNCIEIRTDIEGKTDIATTIYKTA